ncbi:MAG: asparagine synthase-related protein [Gaiellales bacterium]
MAVGTAVYPVLAGVFDPTATFDFDGSRAVLGGVLEREGDGDAVAAGQLAAVRTPARGRRTSDERFLCLLAGRIYNLGELAGSSRAEDPEVVLARLWGERGDAFLGQLSGSFAFALWDREERRGVIVQDQVAARSVYYCTSGSRLFFASDIRPLLAVLPTRPAPDTVSVVHWLANSPPPGQRTMYEGIERLGPGYMLELRDGRWARRRYWEPRYRTPVRRSHGEVSEELWTVVSKAVGARLAAGGSIGIVMSGGVDSSTVATAAMEARNGLPAPRGYSAVFPDEPKMDESLRIQALAEGIGLPSTQMEVEPGGLVALLLEYVARWDLPLSGPGYLLEQPLLARAAADGVDALLDGQGGDEAFGHAPYLLADRIRHGRLISSIRLARRFPLVFERTPWKVSLQIWKLFGLKGAVPYGIHNAVRARRGAEHHAPKLLTGESGRLYFESDDPWAWKAVESGPLWWRYKLSTLTKIREDVGLGEYLRHRAAMAGLEARPPLLDLDLVEFALGVPPALEFDQAADRPLIREGMRGRAPDYVRLWREKSNLGPFYHETLSGHDLEVIRDVLGAEDAEIRAFVRPEIIRDLVEQVPRVGEPGWLKWGTTLFCLFSGECWLRQQSDPSFAQRLRETADLTRPRARVHHAPV